MEKEGFGEEIIKKLKIEQKRLELRERGKEKERWKKNK